tara:strand:+ start:69 stop:1889 length:1821 start_codon:yes stop_codon:yes gene_type:complete
MTYKVSALKWRPNSFDEVIGQQHITKALKNAIQFNRISHAFTFSGPRGVGKTTTARILAKEINQIDDINSSFDIIEMDAASNRGIDEIRNLRESVNIAPAHGKYKIYIIDEVHMLTKEAFNALLKTLEEPPSHVIFVLATTDPHKMPATILSRTQRYDFRRLSIDDIKKQLIIILSAEQKKYDENALNLIARKADGSMRDALGYLDQVINYCEEEITSAQIKKSLGMVSDELYLSLFSNIYNAEINLTINLVNDIINEGVSVQEFISGFNSFLRLMLHKILKVSISNEDFISNWLNENNSITQIDIIRIMEFLIQFEIKMKFIEHPGLALEILLVKLCNFENIININDVMNRLELSKNKSKKSSALNDKIVEKEKKSDFDKHIPEIDVNTLSNSKDLVPKSYELESLPEKDVDTPESSSTDSESGITAVESEAEVDVDTLSESKEIVPKTDELESLPEKDVDISLNNKSDITAVESEAEADIINQSEESILTEQHIKDKLNDIINYIDNKNSKTAGFLGDLEFVSVDIHIITMKANNISNFLYETLKKDINLIKEAFNKVLDSNHDISLLRGKELVKEKSTEVKAADKEHPLFMDVLEKFDGELKR